ncbi:MAG TPA: hypothetical protein V6C88_21175 [Chroococcidiopsis sp.]
MDPLKLKDGRVVTAIDEDDLPSDLFFTVQEKAASNSLANVQRWLMMRLFLVDGQPLTLEHLTEKPPIGIGLRAVGVLNKHTNALISGTPDPKALSDSADLLAGG